MPAVLYRHLPNSGPLMNSSTLGLFVNLCPRDVSTYGSLQTQETKPKSIMNKPNEYDDKKQTCDMYTLPVGLRKAMAEVVVLLSVSLSLSLSLSV